MWPDQALIEMICHPWASTCDDQSADQIWTSISTHYKDMKGDTKDWKWGGLR